MKFINKFYTEGWNVAYKRKEETNYKVIKNNIDSWTADPFIFEYDGDVYIFGEVYEYEYPRGAIGYSKLINGKFSKWKIVIKEKFHLSFPYIIEENGNIYIYPESSANHEFYRYKCILFPDIWIKENVFIDNIMLCDTVFFDKNNRRYGFTYDITNNKNQLRMFEIKNNKLKFLEDSIITDDISIARPGGKVIVQNSEFIRVSQDCKKFYGKAINFVKFDYENGKYKENLIRKIEISEIKILSNQKFKGIHTYNSSKNYEVIDLKFRKIILSSIIYRVINIIRRNFNKWKK